jgi:hypothetical protein
VLAELLLVDALEPLLVAALLVAALPWVRAAKGLLPVADVDVVILLLLPCPSAILA